MEKYFFRFGYHAPKPFQERKSGIVANFEFCSVLPRLYYIYLFLAMNRLYWLSGHISQLVGTIYDPEYRIYQSVTRDFQALYFAVSYAEKIILT